jgi:hypothetical protein
VLTPPVASYPQDSTDGQIALAVQSHWDRDRRPLGKGRSLHDVPRGRNRSRGERKGADAPVATRFTVMRGCGQRRCPGWHSWRSGARSAALLLPALFRGREPLPDQGWRAGALRFARWSA